MGERLRFLFASHRRDADVRRRRTNGRNAIVSIRDVYYNVYINPIVDIIQNTICNREILDVLKRGTGRTGRTDGTDGTQ